VDDIPYFDGPCPKSASIRSYPVVDNMGCVMAWYDPGGRPGSLWRGFQCVQYKRPALKIMQLKTDGPFRTGRKWYSQFFATPEDARDVQGEISGVHYTLDMAKPEDANHNIDDGLPF
jgi:hypothetical protein